MISLRKSISELQHFEELSTAALVSYRGVITAIRDYVVQFDAGEAETYRSHLNVVLQEVERVGSPDVLQRTQRAACDELRDYQRKADRHFKALREELATASEALVEILQSMSSKESHPEEKLRIGLTRLRSIAGQPAIAGVCPDLSAIVQTLDEGVNALEEEHRLVVVQLRDEIRTLHKSIDRANPKSGGRGATLMSRAEIEDLVEEEQRRGSGCCLFLVWVENLARIRRQAGAPTAAEILHQLSARIASETASATVGRWSDDVVVAVDSDSREAMESLRRLSDKLVGPYSASSAGVLNDYTLYIRTGIVARKRYSEAGRFRQACDQLAMALQGRAE